MILMDHMNVYYSDQETPMDLAVIGYLSDNFVGPDFKDLILNRW